MCKNSCDIYQTWKEEVYISYMKFSCIISVWIIGGITYLTFATTLLNGFTLGIVIWFISMCILNYHKFLDGINSREIAIVVGIAPVLGIGLIFSLLTENYRLPYYRQIKVKNNETKKRKSRTIKRI